MLDPGRSTTRKIAVVTGATSGIGLATAHGLAAQGWGVVLVGRSPERGAATLAKIRAETGNPNLDYLNADLSSQAQIRRLAAEFKDNYDRLDVLVNNAGAFFLRRTLTEDGLEKTFALNHLSYFLLTNLVLDILIASAPARIVNVSSNSHYGSPLDFDDLQYERRYRGNRAYGRSKFANILFTYELAQRLEESGVTVNAVHPGWVATNIGRNNGVLARLLLPLIQRTAKSPAEGAETSLYLATSTEVEGVTGMFFVNKKAVQSDPDTYDQTAAGRLWQISARLIELGDQHPLTNSFRQG